jgi:hypothetical protein
MQSLPIVKPLNAREIRQIAVEADVDPRTVVKVIEGQATGSSAAERIKTVLLRRGLVVEQPQQGRKRA